MTRLVIGVKLGSLRMAIRRIITEDRMPGGHAVLSSQNRGDIEQALHWLKLSGILLNAKGLTKGTDGRHHVSVKFSGQRDTFVGMVNARFGSFIVVESKHLNEGPRGGMGMSAGPPYKSGRHSLGWGTGMGGFNVVHPSPAMGGYPNKFGGQHIKSNPVKPYSNEFSDELGDQRKTEFDAAAQRFIGAAEKLRQSLSAARSFDRIDELVLNFVGGDDESYNEIMGDEGTLRSLVRANEVQKAVGVISSNIEAWSRKRLSIAAGTDLDAGVLERFGGDATTYEPTVNHIMRWS